MRTIENCNLLFQKNEAGSCFKVSQKYVIHHRGSECNGATMHRLIKEINGCLQKCSDRRLKIILDFGKVRFKDKLTYIILESICYSLIKDYGHIVVIRGEFQEIRSKDIFCGGIRCSPLRYLFIDKKENRDNFIRLFEKKCIEKNHKDSSNNFNHINFKFPNIRKYCTGIRKSTNIITIFRTI